MVPDTDFSVEALPEVSVCILEVLIASLSGLLFYFNELPIPFRNLTKEKNQILHQNHSIHFSALQ
jgi:hypothetical protein